ncbi:hypothetical protein [Cereibacter johrii]|uniref:hypothetical protein n=1 Tax=Cereibacter johrii TaxID=445629 RepID=UPI003CF0A1A3
MRREIDSIVSAVASGMFPAGMKAKMDGAEAERADLEARLAEIPDPEPVAIHPGLSGIYARRVTHLVSALNDTKADLEAAAIMRGLIEEFVLSRDASCLPGRARHRAFAGQTVIKARPIRRRLRCERLASMWPRSPPLRVRWAS